MITDDGKKQHYLTVKSISALFRGMTSNNNGDYYCLHCFHSYRTNNKLRRHERLCDKHDYCHVEMPKEDNKILKYNHGEKSLKAPFIIIADLECILPKISSCQNNPEKSYTERKANMSLQVTHGLHVVHLMHQKTNEVITEEKTAWKGFLNI